MRKVPVTSPSTSVIVLIEARSSATWPGHNFFLMTPLQVIDGPEIRERRLEAARSVVDLLWALVCRAAIEDGEPHLAPGLIAHQFPPELRRPARASAS